MKPIATLTTTQKLLNDNDLKAKKHLGQNFLVDIQIIDKIVRSSKITQNDGCIEIGPGLGALTQSLVSTAKKVVSFEIDHKLEQVLHEQFDQFDNFTLVMQDFMKVDLQSVLVEHFQECEHVHVVANLPYYITTAILIKIFESKTNISSMTVMMQKEVAQRFNAKVGTKQYNSLTILTQYFADVSYEFTVPTGVFVPRPKVESAVVRFSFRKYPILVKDEEFFFKLLRESFQFRRKTLFNNLKPYFIDLQDAKAKLSEVGLDPVQRAETVTIDQFINLANYLWDSQNDL